MHLLLHFIIQIVCIISALGYCTLPLNNKYVWHTKKNAGHRNRKKCLFMLRSGISYTKSNVFCSFDNESRKCKRMKEKKNKRNKRTHHEEGF